MSLDLEFGLTKDAVHQVVVAEKKLLEKLKSIFC